MRTPTATPENANTVIMIGLDFGSTTSSAMVATAQVGQRAVTGRMTFGVPRVVYRSDPVFTPFTDKTIDPVRLEQHIDRWIDESGINCPDLFAGGAIITGLAAKRTNAAAVARLVAAKIGQAIIATADDPSLESWLAFMGSCSVLSRFHSQTPMINIDIGGGTTNPALGINGNVMATGCHFVGARHFQFEPGTYRLLEMSPYGRALIDDLAIEKRSGDTLTAPEVDAILGFYVDALEAIATGNSGFFETPVAGLHQQVPFAFDTTGPAPVLVFSGGVGELVYRCSQGSPLPGTTHFGDLGIDLARKIVDSPVLSAHIWNRVPENMGRATVYGLALHSTEISGATLFLSDPDLLPCSDLPIVARLPVDATAAATRQALALVKNSPNGACLQIVPEKGPETDNGPPATGLSTIKALGRRLHAACADMAVDRPVVLLVPENYGQALGNYASNWRQSPVRFVVIDEISDRRAHFVNIGRLHDNIVPVSFYGVH